MIKQAPSPTPSEKHTHVVHKLTGVGEAQPLPPPSFPKPATKRHLETIKHDRSNANATNVVRLTCSSSDPCGDQGLDDSEDVADAIMIGRIETEIPKPAFAESSPSAALRSNKGCKGCGDPRPDLLSQVRRRGGRWATA
ncbi:hypothetical protein VDGL01_12125 [Verticillium dahliae]